MPSAIDIKYEQVIHDNPWIGKPTTGENVCPDGVGHYRHYAGGASIYWTPQTGAHLIYGYIRYKWSVLGWEKSPVGYPVTDEGDAGSKHGRYNNFQNGTIIWKADTKEAFAVYGAIYGKWGEHKFDWGDLGFPLTDETGTPDGVGRFNHFDGGSIYWTPETGAHVVRGAIRNAWQQQGWERSRLQYPRTDELVTDGTGGRGRNNIFEGGEILWTPEGGTKINLYPVASIVRSPDHNLETDKVHTSNVWVKLFSDGTWQFHAFLHDSSTFYGDSYAIGFVFDGDGHGAVISGTLGADLSGPAKDNDQTIGGTDPWIEQSWHKVNRTGMQFHLRVSGDPGSALGSVLKDIEQYGPALISLLA